MLIGKEGAISPEIQAQREQQAEAQRLIVAQSEAERKRIHSLTNTQLGYELRRAGLRASKCSGTGFKVNNVDFGPTPANGLDAAYSSVFSAVMKRDLGAGPGLRNGNDPYYLVYPKRPKRTRTRAKVTSTKAA
jgi:hypothetical protein